MIFDKFINKERVENLKFDKMITAHKSETTHSAYFDFKTTNGSYYSLAVSDHESDNHLFDITDVLDDTTDEIDDFHDFLNQWIHDDDFLADCDFYEMNKISQYSLDPTTLIGGYSEARAFISDEFKVMDAKLIYDGHFLEVTYTDLKGNNSETEVYNGYVPKMGNIDDIATINYLISNENVHDARKMYYQNGNAFTLTPSDEYVGDDMEGEEYEFAGKNYVAEYELLDEAENGAD